MESNEKKPTLVFSITTLFLVLAVIVGGLMTGVGAHLSLFFATGVSVIAALVYGIKWSELQEAMFNTINKNIPAMTILIFVGILVGVWSIGGSLPALIYYGLKYMSPAIIVPSTFILCALTSIFTGTSFGSIATMGLVLFSVGTNMGIPANLMAGAVVSGSCFGDKMSPMSDTTNLSSATAEVDIYEHITSMLYTTIPATIVVVIIFSILGLPYASNAADVSEIQNILSVLKDNYNVGWYVFLPLCLVIVLSVKKVPAILTMGITVVVSIIFAMMTQDVALPEVTKVALNGFQSETGIKTIDSILSRGGAVSMAPTITLIFFASMMGGVLMRTGVLKTVIDDGILKKVKSWQSLVVATLLYCYGVLAVTGNQTLAIVLPGQTFATAYDKLDINRRVLSRSLEDAGTIGGAIIPWSSFCLYVCSVLPVDAGYIPYALLNYIVPIFSVICVITGFGIWNKEGMPMRHNKKSGQKM